MSSRLLTAALLAGPSLAVAQTAPAAGGLSRVKSGLDSAATQILTIVGSAGVVALLFAGLGWAFGWTGLSLVGQIAGGLLICAAVYGIVGIFFPS